MRFFASFIFALFTGLVAASSSISSNFSLEISASGTILESSSIYLGTDDKIYVANISAQNIYAQIISNGSLLVDSELVMGIGKNYLSLTAQSNSFIIAAPWTISDGSLKLYGSDFHAVPSGEDNIYVIGSINAAAGRDDVIPIGIKAMGTDGALLDSFTAASYSGASSTVSVLASTQTYNSAASSSKNAAAPVIASGASIGSGLFALFCALVF